MSEPLIKIANLWHRYPSGKAALRGIDLAIQDGEFVALIGQNGAGKSTLFKHLNGLLKPTEGEVYVADRDVSDSRTAQMASVVGFLFQNPDYQIFCASVQEEVAFGLKRMGIGQVEIEHRVGEALSVVGLRDKADAHPYSLSKGQRQRVALASVLAMEPRVLVIDEPTTGQDYRQTLQIMDLIRRLHEQGTTILMVTHNMSLVAEYAARTVVLGGGRVLADGPTREVLAMEDLLAETGLRPPQVTRLGRAMGVEETLLTVGEAKEHLTKGSVTRATGDRGYSRR
jgi:energy-coupling factor transport system ATP-binding protein